MLNVNYCTKLFSWGVYNIKTIICVFVLDFFINSLRINIRFDVNKSPTKIYFHYNKPNIKDLNVQYVLYLYTCVFYSEGMGKFSNDESESGKILHHSQFSWHINTSQTYITALNTYHICKDGCVQSKL